MMKQPENPIDSAPPGPTSRAHQVESLWYYFKDEQRVGPVALTELQRLVATGQLEATALVLQQGQEQWVSVTAATGVPPGLDTPAADDSKLFAATLSANARTRPITLSAADLPHLIGRYRVEKILGRGNFGYVLLAHDDELKRLVAIKVPHRERIETPEAAEAFLTEARVLASLDHPHIVPVFDVGRSADGVCFVVSKFIEGSDLAQRIEEVRLPCTEAAAIVAAIAEALQHAHQRGLIHRDVKTANILLDTAGKPYLADFGLALKEEDFGQGTVFAGTPAYMSPEQARGEGHRVDGRSDIFSLGVVFYELLIGQRPFVGKDVAEVLDQVATAEVRPPRQLDEAVPKELERVCLKALAKRAAERYATAQAMADDVRHFVKHAAQAAARACGPTGSASYTPTPPVGKPAPVDSEQRYFRVVPKGLRSFDAHDADFFLELLPGPRDRDGLPDSLRFWKTRIEERDPDGTFAVGLLYGPSGCGKSSLVKAGLLPRLARDVLVVYVEATAQETETRLLNGLRKRCPALPATLGLKEALTALRRGQGLQAGQKVLLVVDQFEQWLHSKREEPDPELVQALRQCDGCRLQCLVMVRDDFWMAVTRFLRQLEVRLIEGENSMPVDLFPARHAVRVLRAFGQAFGILPERTNLLTEDQKQFLEQAISGLAQEGKVICVRLALFAEMMKSRPWTPASLQAVGGTEGVGVTFLEESFSAASAPLERRQHQQGARLVLQALLPETGTDLKGHMRSSAELLRASGYGNRTHDFAELIRILDRDIRLITPTDPEGKDRPDSALTRMQLRETYYQLTHDYLVPSLREWLTYKQKETRRGRAELRLAERARAWEAHPESRHLPAWWEWVSIRAFTRPRAWTAAERRLMGAADRFYMVRTVVAAALLGVLAGIGFYQERRLANMRGFARAQQLIGIVRSFRTSQVGEFQIELQRYQKWAKPMLEEMIADPDTNRRDRLHARLLLLPMDDTQAAPLTDALLGLDNAEFAEVWRALEPHKELLRPHLEVRLVRPAHAGTQEQQEQSRARAAGALMRLGRAEVVWPLLRRSSDPDLRTFLIHDLPAVGVDPQVLVDHLASEPDLAVRRAILLALGGFPADRLTPEQRQAFSVRLHGLYRDEPDPGLHAAVEWLLRQWGEEAWLTQTQAAWARDQAERSQRLDHIRRTLAGAHPLPQWYVNDAAQTMVVIPGPADFLMGSPVTEAGRTGGPTGTSETQHRQRIARSFALASKEVTLAQFRVFRPKHVHQAEYARTLAHPVNSIRWYDAAAYCNWLSAREGLPQDQWCYEPNDQGNYAEGMKPAADYLQRSGYRLPSEAEWEYACRAGASTSHSFGDSEALLGKYAWYSQNSGARWMLPVGSLKPNDLGLFDMHGNAREWCQDPLLPYRTGPDGQPTDDVEQGGPITDGDARVVRGGSLTTGASDVRSAFRTSYGPTHASTNISFRPARTITPLQP